jgi:hypothetical protein
MSSGRRPMPGPRAEIERHKVRVMSVGVMAWQVVHPSVVV